MPTQPAVPAAAIPGRRFSLWSNGPKRNRHPEQNFSKTGKESVFLGLDVWPIGDQRQLRQNSLTCDCVGFGREASFEPSFSKLGTPPSFSKLGIRWRSFLFPGEIPDTPLKTLHVATRS